MFRANFPASWLLFCALTLVSCAGQRNIIGPQAEPPTTMGPPVPDTHEAPKDVYGPAVPPDATVTSSTIATGISTSVATGTAVPTASETATATATVMATGTAGSSEPAKLCLVLGPGMAKAMAEAAVLESIRRAKIPVHCVVGTEMGAIVGALYASSNGNTNNLNWQLFKLNKDNYFAFPMLSLREPRSTGHKLNEFLRGVFRDAQIERFPIRFATTAIDDDGDNTAEFERGGVADALSASAAIPGIFESWKIGDHSYRSAASAEPAPVELAKKLGGNFIVLVDVLVDGGTAPSKSRFHRAFTPARSVLKLQKKEASFVIPVNTGSIAFDDFSRRADILAAGSAAAEKAIPELKAAWEKWSTGH